MDELQAGVEQPLAVFPQPPVFLQPRKAAFHLNRPGLSRHFEPLGMSLLELYR